MKTAIVTGASRGVGYATVKLLEKSGYHVIAVSRSIDKMQDLASDNVEIYQLDITSEEQIKKFHNTYKDISLDLLVNNAGGGASPTKIIDETPENFRIAYDINVTGPMLLSNLFVPSMKKSQSPTIIFVTSLCGVIPFRGGGNYSNAKRGEMALIDTMRLEFPEYNIKITEIRPGTIDTQIERKPFALTAEDMAEAIRWVADLPRHVNINHIEISHLSNTKY